MPKLLKPPTDGYDKAAFDAWCHKWETIEWTCFYCPAKGRGVKNQERHLVRHWWDWMPAETEAALKRGDGSVWVCRFDVGDSDKPCRPCRSEKHFRGHMWHEHAGEWLYAWSCIQEID
jgi:hypothetical protein